VCTSDALGGVARFSFQMSAASADDEAMMRSIELLGTRSRRPFVAG
jgi:hypothetical protein